MGRRGLRRNPSKRLFCNESTRMRIRSFIQMLVASLASLFGFKGSVKPPICTRWVCIYDLGWSHLWCEEMAARFTLDSVGQVERWVRMPADPIHNPDNCIGRFETTVSMEEWSKENDFLRNKYTSSQRLMLGRRKINS